MKTKNGKATYPRGISGYNQVNNGQKRQWYSHKVTNVCAGKVAVTNTRKEDGRSNS